MTTSLTIDLEPLLAPIQKGNLQGLDVRQGLTYRTLKEARRYEDAIDDGPLQRKGKSPDWQKVVQSSTKILTEEGKDLEVLVWLTEGLVKKHGFAGLRDGLKAIALIHEKCWSELFPALSEEGFLDARATRLEALNNILPAAIRTIPLIQLPGGISYSYWDHDKGHEGAEKLKGAVQAAKTEEQRGYAQAALDEARQLGEKMDQAVTAAPRAHFAALRDLVCQSLEALEELDRISNDKYGQDGPSLRQVREVIEDCRDLLDAIVRKKGGAGLHSDNIETKSEAQAVSTTAGGEISVSGELRTRAEALSQLTRVAEFFRRTEPHSPVSYLVQRAARWGEMPLEEWLQEVIKNEGVLGEVKETLGLAQNHTTTTTES